MMMMTHDDGDGDGDDDDGQVAMEMANSIGGEKKVDYINTHGTSTPVGDTAEVGGAPPCRERRTALPPP